jgi:SAM-dependent methyltransferase
MLDVFRGRLGAVDRRRTRLSHADANQTWPLADGSVAVVFASRVAHLLQTCHLVAELERVCRAGGYFVVGWVVRDSDGAKSRLRQQRRLLLQQRGLARRDREPVIKRALDGLLAAGATQVEARPVARWTASASVQEILTSWETVGAMGGRQIDANTRARLLDELRSWAIRELGDVSVLATWEERYMLEGVCLPASPCAQ